MTHTCLRPFAILLLAVAGSVVGNSSAQAQFYATNTYYNTPYSMPYNFYSYQYLSVSGMNSNGPYQFSRYSYNYGPVPQYNNFNNSNYYVPPSGTMSGGYGTTPDNQNPVLDRQRSALKSAQNSAKYAAPNTGSSKLDFDGWLSEQSTRREANNPMQPALEVGLINPNDDQLLSGQALNDLAARILSLESKGKKATPGLCPPELVGKIVFTGGGAADALNGFHNAKIDYPEILKMPDFTMLVEAFDKAYAPISEAVQAGKKVLPADVERLLTVIEKSKPMTEPMMRSAPFKDATAILAFYASLEAGLKFLKLPESVGVIGSKWNSIGVNVSDLVKHLHKFQIRFGRSESGDDAAYGSLHRGLLAYYAALSQAK
jgi:hypothetical protein